MAKSRDWCWTLNNPTEEGRWISAEAFIARMADAYPTLEYMCFCLEEGENKTPHWQGFSQFTNAVSLTRLNKVMKGAHLEQRRGSPQQAVDYIKRTGPIHSTKGGLLGGPWEYGKLNERDQQGARTDIAACLELHLEHGGGAHADLLCAERYGSTWIRYANAIQARSRLIISHRAQQGLPEPKEVLWYHGPTGTGKTRRVYELEGVAVDVVTLSGDRQAPFFNGVFGHEAMLLDDLRPEQASFAFFLRLFDRYPMMLNVKGSCAHLQAKRIYVTSHFSPEEFAAMCGGVAEDPRQLTRRITQVVDFKNAEADSKEPEVIDVTDEEMEQPAPKRPRLERHGAMSHLEEEVLVQEAQEGRTPRTLQEIIDREEAREDSGDDADFEED